MKHKSLAGVVSQPVCAGKHRITRWLPAATLVALLAALSCWAAGVFNPSADARASAPLGGTSASQGAASTAPLSGDLRTRLQGRWLRRDGGYVLAIQSIAEDGKIAATYANPRPINVSKALVTQREGKSILLIELRDRNYPGNYYTLTYDPARDQLAGDYHHLALNQVFDVNFERLR